MPSLAESKREVKASLDSLGDNIDHDAILASLQDEIDMHNDGRSDTSRSKAQCSERKRRRSREHEDMSRARGQFRFKSGVSDPGRRHRHESRSKRHRASRHSDRDKQARSYSDAGSGDQGEGSHPFPREPTEPHPSASNDSTTAFRESLFDALADDEGAAYWEGVYNQPIHIYPRPMVETPKGELEEMNDEQYAAYVQTKMWEKKNPHIVKERERTEKRRKEEEEDTARRREEYVRRKQRAAWERAQEEGGRRFAGVEDDNTRDYEYVFDFEDRKGSASKRSTPVDGGSKEFLQAWSKYLAAWEELKTNIANGTESATDNASKPSVAGRIPWPVLPSKPAIKRNIEPFFEHMPVPADGDRTRLQLLKAERVRWHPDKIQHRFGGNVDEGTMKIVTGIFQIVDDMVEQQRKREAR
ncbi:uncharacterized protein K489DRAFT_381217 [Dissoconium aciculare CBS 342.82]|uniref:Uncharacterized protein n=1 Tax=Dissoconium aciculare CBS 342.82 TaxID=1314786 RepID=A0A6J3M3I2_9PEZI|nr:uncharacterized protein K489DRAFT_381217 [Dissoconium aciculare CBS 342.82]KAF1822458.1 hypothetical protein K489DRAFT_381217 [Dissoconium aciculare CBS 342.82]